MNQSINTDSKNIKEPQQKYRLGTVSTKTLGGLNRFYRRPTSPSASITAQNTQLLGPRGGPPTHQWTTTRNKQTTNKHHDEAKTRTRQKRAATDTRRPPGRRTTPPEHRSRRKPTAEPRRAKQQTKKPRPKPTKTNSPMSGPSLSLTPDPPACNQRGKQSHQPRLGQTPSTQTAALHLCHTQHACNERQPLRTDQKNQPHPQPFWTHTPSHHKTPAPTGPDAKVPLIQHRTQKPTHSVGDKIWRKPLEVHDTDSPAGEAWQPNFHYGHRNQPHDQTPQQTEQAEKHKPRKRQNGERQHPKMENPPHQNQSHRADHKSQTKQIRLKQTNANPKMVPRHQRHQPCSTAAQADKHDRPCPQSKDCQHSKGRPNIQMQTQMLQQSQLVQRQKETSWNLFHSKIKRNQPQGEHNQHPPEHQQPARTTQRQIQHKHHPKGTPRPHRRPGKTKAYTAPCPQKRIKPVSRYRQHKANPPFQKPTQSNPKLCITKKSISKYR